MFFAGALLLELAQCDLNVNACKETTLFVNKPIIWITIVSSFLLVMCLVSFVVDGYRRFYRKWKAKGGSQTYVVVYTPLNIATSAILCVITVMLLLLLN